MKYYQPEFFRPEEIFSKFVIEKHLERGTNDSIKQSIWGLMDGRILWTMDMIRKRFGSTIVNDYLWKGNNQQRGFRSIEELMLAGRKDLIFTSQHCFGRAIDSKNPKYTAEEIRVDIILNKDWYGYQYIKAVEKDVSWLHIDCRSLGLLEERQFFSA